MLRTFKIYSLGSFHICNTVLLTVVTMLYVTSPELTYLLSRSLYFLTFIHFPFPGYWSSKWLQLTIEQHRLELCRSTYIWVFFTKYILQYHTIWGWLNSLMWNHQYRGQNCKIRWGFSTVVWKVNAFNPCLVQGSVGFELDVLLRCFQLLRFSISQ